MYTYHVEQLDTFTCMFAHNDFTFCEMLETDTHTHTHTQISIKPNMCILNN